MKPTVPCIWRPNATRALIVAVFAAATAGHLPATAQTAGTAPPSKAAGKPAPASKAPAAPPAPPAPRWWQVPLSDRLNAALASFSGRVNAASQQPLADRLNAGLDNVFAGMSLLWRPPPDGSAAWWEKPLADRLNQRIDAVQLTIRNLERRDFVNIGQTYGLSGPVIWPNRVLPEADGVVDPQAAIGLQTAWQAARSNDPSLRAARAGMAAAEERVPQARALMLPLVQASATRLSNDLRREGLNTLGQPLDIFDRYPSANQTLTLRQPVLRLPLVAGIRQAEAQVREAQAIHDREVQDFSARVVLAYLEVLLAQDTLQVMDSQRQFLEAAVTASESALERGVGTRTDIDAARAKLDLNRAQSLEAQQQIEFARRQLQSYIARPFGSLVPFDGQRLNDKPLTDRPLDEWLSRAEAASPEVRRLLAQRDAIRQDLNKARSAHLPTVDVVLQSQRSRSENTLSPSSQFTNNTMGLQITLPLYAGGAANSQARQAGAEIERAEELLNALKADLGVRVHREYRGVVEGMSRVRALEAAVRSAEVALDSARKSVLAGVRTQVDVLNAEQQRMQTLRDLSQARYASIAALTKLHALTGEANEELIQRLNSLLVP